MTIGGSAAGIFDLAGFNQSMVGIAKGGFAATVGNSSATSDSTLTLTGTSSFAGVIQDVLGTGTMKVNVAVNGGSFTLAGANTYTGNTIVSSGTLELADNAQLKFVLGAISGSNNSISGAGTATLEGDFVIDTTAADSLPSGTWTLENVNSLTGAYGSNFTVIGFTDAGGNKWTKDNGPTKKYTFDETTGELTLGPSSAYSTWANSKGLTGLPGSSTDPAKDADPDKDGKNNLFEFAFDGDPLSGANDGKIVGKVATLGGNQVLTLTLPVRAGAVFNPDSGDQLSGVIDEIVYRIEGDKSLNPFADAIAEVTGGDATTIQDDLELPALSGDGWTYRTFRAPDNVTTEPKAFLRAKVTSDTP
jgi:autotransporter-associated beta strand protein